MASSASFLASRALEADADGEPARGEPLDATVAIETPEHIVFRHRLAGPARRMLAYLLDLLICYGAVFLLALLVISAIGGGMALDEAHDSIANVGVGFMLLLLFAAQWVYFCAFEAMWSGQSPGKRLTGLRVVATNGRPIDFAAAALRNVLRAADALPTAYAVGFVSMTLTRRFQRLGDLVAGTMVIVPERAQVAGAIRLWPPAQPEEIAALEAREVTLDADERTAIELFLRRRGTLGPAREHELASLVAEPLARRFGLPMRDPVRTLALLYDRAANAGRDAAPPSSSAARTGGAPWR